jgi:hypothetical protein
LPKVLNFFLPPRSNWRSIIPSDALHLSEELPIPLLPSISTCDQHPCTIDCKECTDAVEFAGEDLEHDKCDGKSGQQRADIGTFEGALCGTDFDKLSVGWVDGSSAVEAQRYLSWG